MASEWSRLKDLLDRLLDLDAAGQAAFIEALSPADAALAPRLRKLLRAHGDSEHLLADVSAAVMSGLRSGSERDAAAASRLGEVVGKYRLMRVLGVGGMGAVFLAERMDGLFSHAAAVKIFNAPLGSDLSRSRFDLERSILATLHHAGIAQLHDGGETGFGEPYFSMEFVDGVPITEYCERHRLTTRARVDLLLQVASALGYAHQRLVVHRDVKPSNILVQADGICKVVDFGIAKLLTEDLQSDVMRNAIGPMTPEYAAPEQFRAGPITLATDVYQFGVLCFRVLSGAYPYSADPRDSFAWSRAVVVEEPRSMARAALRNGAAENSPRAARELRGDLDAIVRKALQKEPA